jgi:hypothetical protein
MSLTESPSLTIFPQEFTAMDEPIADYNRLLPVAIARAVLEAAGTGTEMAAHLSPSFLPSLSLLSDHLRTVLAVKGSLRRAQQRRALDRSGTF